MSWKKHGMHFNYTLWKVKLVEGCHIMKNLPTMQELKKLMGEKTSINPY